MNLFANVDGVLKPLLDADDGVEGARAGPELRPALALPGRGRARRDLQAVARLPVRRVRGAARQVRRALVILGLVDGLSAYVVLTTGFDERGTTRLRVELDNAFGLIQGGDLKVAGVRAGQITDIRLDKRTKHALVGFRIDKDGFGSLRRDVHCESRPQSLIGEYFLDCLPGTARAGAEAGRADPRRADVVDDRARPRQRHPPRARARAAADHRLGARRGRRRARARAQRRDPPRDPGAARDGQASSTLLGEQNRTLAGPDRQRRHGRRRPRRQPQGRRPLRR